MMARGCAFRRRSLLAVAVLGSGIAAGLTLAAAPASPPAAAVRAAPVSPANKAQSAEHFARARSLSDQGQFAPAMAENDQALRLDPNNADAIGLRFYLQARVAATASRPATATRPATTVAAGANVKLLTPQQISTIRLMEAGPNDVALRGRIEIPALEAYWAEVIAPRDPSRQTHDAFRNAPFIVQASRIRETGDFKFINQVMVASDPLVFQIFKNAIHPLVMQNCATSECHGGEKAGAFHLIAGNPSDAAIYTNFYILSTYVTKAGNKTINRDTPDASLLLQFQFPKGVANIPHPETADPRRTTGPADQRLRILPEWIKSLNYPRPGYGPGLEPAVPVSATRTATAAASAPTSRPATAPTLPATRP